MKRFPYTNLAALAVIGIGGFVAGRIATPDDALSGPSAGPAETRSSRTTAGGGTGETRREARVPRVTRTERAKPAEKDRLGRLEAIMRGENPLDRNRALLAFLDTLGPGDFEGAIAHFRGLGITESRTGEYALLLTAWAQADPLTALDYAKKNARGDFAQDTILTSWASTDPEAAIRWAESNYEGDGPNPYIPGIIRGLSQLDPARATQLLTSLPRSEERGKGLDYMLPHLLEQGSEATRNWISALTDESLRNGAMLRAAEKLAASDPEATSAWLLANPGQAADRRLDDVYSAWARQDQQAALSSFSALPPGPARSNALRGVVSNIAAADVQAAVSLMNRYPSDVNDRIVQNFVWHATGSDPATAASQIPRIADERERDQTYRRMLGSWMERDPAAAQSWMQSNPVPESVRERLNRQAERQR